MANSLPWAERTGSERRRTLGMFGLLYAAITLGAIALAWTGVAIIFGVLSVGVAVGWFFTDSEELPVESKPERERPDWMKAMDDPNAPDLSLPEYRSSSASSDADESARTPPRATTSSPESVEPPDTTPASSPFDRPEPSATVTPEEAPPPPTA